MLDACLEHKFLPPVIVHPDAAHVRDISLYDAEQGVLAAVAHISGWGWHCDNAMVRTARVVYIDEVIEGDGLCAADLKANAESKESAAGPMEPGTIPLLNCLAIHHQFNDVMPSHAEILESAIRNRKKLMQHPLFPPSIKKMQTEPLVQTFYLTYSDHVGLAVRETVGSNVFSQ